VCPSAEGAQTLQHLSGIFGFEQVDGQKAVVCRKIERRHLAGLEEMRDVLHLDERHAAGLVSDAWGGHGEVDQFAERDAILERVK